MRSVIIAMILAVCGLLQISTPAQAEYAVRVSRTCVDGPSTKTINGVSVTRDCWKYTSTYDVYTDNWTNYCAPLAQKGCARYQNTCTQTGPNGTCTAWTDRYRCGDQATSTGIVHLDTEYTIVQDEITENACASYSGNQDCSQVSQVCTEGGATRTIDGMPVYKDCWAWNRTYSCFATTTTNRCSSLTAGCTSRGKTCVEHTPTGKCAKWQHSYICENKQTTGTGIVGDGTEHEIIGEDIDRSACTSMDASSECEQSGSTCTEGAETRTINGMPIYRDCWGWRDDYQCLSNNWIDNCSSAPSNCTTPKRVCLSYDSKGKCSAEELQYDCPSQTTVEEPERLICDGGMYCFDGGCEQMPADPSPDFPEAVAYLNILKAIQDELEPDTPSVFPAEAKTCKRDVVGINNCCNEGGSGIFNPVFGCSDDEKELWKAVDLGLTHYVGTYCSAKTLGVCTRKRKSYCVFDSKLGRIIQQQGRQQINKPWGEPDEPDCSGFLVEELTSLNFSTMNFDEVIDDFYRNITVPDTGQAQNFVADRLKSFYDQN